jgi:phage replication O-like protein O
MASPQIEEGYTKIANEILEALAKTNLNAYQWRILMVIFRKTYGWKKRQDKIAQSQFIEMTNISKSNLHRTIRELKAMNIIGVSSDTKNGRTVWFNKDYHSWKKVSDQTQVSRQTPKGVSLDTKKVSDQRPTKEKKETTKEKEPIKIEYPTWLDLNLWEQFKAMRKEIKKPMTEVAEKYALAKLARMRNVGQDPSAVIQQSIDNTWQGLFDIKSGKLKNVNIAGRLVDLEDRPCPNCGRIYSPKKSKIFVGGKCPYCRKSFFKKEK